MSYWNAKYPLEYSPGATTFRSANRPGLLAPQLNADKAKNDRPAD